MYMYIYIICTLYMYLSLYIDRQPLNEQSSLPTHCHWDRSLLLFVWLWKSRSSERTMTAYLTSCYTAMLVWFLVHPLDPGSSRMETVFQAHSWVLTWDMTGQSLNDLGRAMSVQHAPGSKMFQGWLHVVYWHWEVPGYPRYRRTWKLRGRKHQPDNEMQEYQWFNWAQVQPSQGWYQYLSIWYCGFIICLEWKASKVHWCQDSMLKTSWASVAVNQVKPPGRSVQYLTILTMPMTNAYKCFDFTQSIYISLGGAPRPVSFVSFVQHVILGLKDLQNCDLSRSERKLFRPGLKMLNFFFDFFVISYDIWLVWLDSRRRYHLWL